MPYSATVQCAVAGTCVGQLPADGEAMTTEPAMLRYLNGYANTKKAPDENYGGNCRNCSPSEGVRIALHGIGCKSGSARSHRITVNYKTLHLLLILTGMTKG